MTAPRGGSAHDEGARPSDAADKEANKLSESPVDARSSQGVQINERGDNLQLNIFMNRADVGTPIATPDEFKADVVAMLENLDNAARRLTSPRSFQPMPMLRGWHVQFALSAESAVRLKSMRTRRLLAGGERIG